MEGLIVKKVENLMVYNIYRQTESSAVNRYI